ncbi:hypothetical protein [Streptomyces caniscabiei]
MINAALDAASSIIDVQPAQFGHGPLDGLAAERRILEVAGQQQAGRPSLSTSPRTWSASTVSSGRWTMATSAPSLAYSSATARPMPESAPVISATSPSSFPQARYRVARQRGAVRVSASRPGRFRLSESYGGAGSETTCAAVSRCSDCETFPFH